MPGNITLKQIRYIDVAGRTGSISAAADELNISQSSITAAIDSLEADLGFDIFSRIPAKGIQPTPRGVELLTLIRRYLSETRSFESELYALAGSMTGTIKLACFATPAATFLPPAIERFQAEFPDVRFELIEGDMDTVVDYIDDGIADIAFTYKEVTSENHAFEGMVDLPHFALVRNQDPLAEKSSLSLDDLKDKPMIGLQLARSRTYYFDLFKRAGLSVNVAHTSSSVEMIRTLVASGFGFSILNARPVSAALDSRGICVRPLTDHIPDRPFGIIYQAKLNLPIPVKKFIVCCNSLRTEGVFEKLAVRAR